MFIHLKRAAPFAEGGSQSPPSALSLFLLESTVKAKMVMQWWCHGGAMVPCHFHPPLSFCSVPQTGFALLGCSSPPSAPWAGLGWKLSPCEPYMPPPLPPNTSTITIHGGALLHFSNSSPRSRASPLLSSGAESLRAGCKAHLVH
jgi:hypothetical protein